ncbi:MAG: signal peptidase II [Eubacteriales bacterium]|nr:signal peptidase II [Eubacteriales bacterium]
MKKSCQLSPILCAAAGIFMVFALTLLDQWTKQLAVSGLKGRPSIVLIPEVLELKYLENTGIAFGMFAGKTTVFLILCFLFFLAALYLYLRIPKTRYYMPLLGILLLMSSGAAGNFIDRVVRGYVVDFVYFSLIDFPIFNVADIYVVCSGILLVLFTVFKYNDEDFAFLHPRYKRENDRS